MLSTVKENSHEFLDAKKRELNSLKENNVFNWVEDHGQTVFHASGSSQRNIGSVKVRC